MKILEKQFLRCRNKSNKLQMRENYTYQRSKFDKLLRLKERKFNTNKLQEIEYNSKHSPNEFWKAVQKLGPSKKSTGHTGPFVLKNGIISYNLNIIRQKWFLDFQNLYNALAIHDGCLSRTFYSYVLKEVERMELTMKEVHYSSNMFLNGPISVREVENISKNLKNKKAVGIDNISYEMLKNKNVLCFMANFFNYCFENGVVPDIWGKAIISPILKAGKEPGEPLNYRGVSLLSCAAKLYSSVIQSRISGYCEITGQFADEQNAFRKGRSCTDHIFVLTNILENRLFNGKSTFCAFVDMKKAFDLVNRSLLFYRLLKFNINGKIFNAIKALYVNNLSYVRITETLNTDWFNIPTGVRQGDPLSATLFSIFINEIVNHLSKLNIGVEVNGKCIYTLLYADDIVLIGSTEAELQSLLVSLEEWCHLYQLQVNISKKKVMHFRSNRKQMTNFNFILNTQTVEKVNMYKYLGVYLDEHMKYDKHIEKMAESGSRALSSIIANLKV